jgi:hypothetical protein
MFLLLLPAKRQALAVNKEISTPYGHDFQSPPTPSPPYVEILRIGNASYRSTYKNIHGFIGNSYLDIITIRKNSARTDLIRNSEVRKRRRGNMVKE